MMNSPIDKLRMLGINDPRIAALFQQQSSNVPTPVAPQPGGPVKQPGFFDRLQDGLMPAPQGLLDSGMMTPEDVKGAQSQGLLGLGASLLADSGPKLAKDYVGPMASLGRAIQAGQGSYQGAVSSAASMRSAGLDYKGKKAALDKAGQLDVARKAIIAKYPVPQNDPGAMAQWVDTVLPHFIEAEDDETVKSLVDLRKSLVPKERYQQASTGNLSTNYDTQTGKFWDPTANGGKGDWVMSVEKHMPADQLALKQGAADLATARSQLAQANAGNARTDRLAGTWDKNTKSMFDRVMPVNQALMALDAAKTDPTVGGNALIAVMSAVDPKAQQRYQMVNWVNTHLTPALATTAERYLMGKTTGMLPPSLIAALEAHVRRTRDMVISQEGRTYNEYVKIHPEMRDQLRRIGTEFEPDAPAPTAAPRLPGESPQDYLKRTGGQ